MNRARISVPPPEEVTRPSLPEVADDVDTGWEEPVAAEASFEGPSERETSYIGTLPRETDGALEIARKRHASLVASIANAEQECERFESYDLSAQAAEISLRKRVGALAFTRNVLETAVDIAAQENALEGPIAPYLAGVYLWLDGVSEALGTLASQLNAVAPDWAAFRSSLAEICWLYEMTIVEQARLDASDVFAGRALGEAVENLAQALVHFKAALEEPFG